MCGSSWPLKGVLSFLLFRLFILSLHQLLSQLQSYTTGTILATTEFIQLWDHWSPWAAPHIDWPTINRSLSIFSRDLAILFSRACAILDFPRACATLKRSLRLHDWTSGRRDRSRSRPRNWGCRGGNPWVASQVSRSDRGVDFALPAHLPGPKANSTSGTTSRNHWVSGSWRWIWVPDRPDVRDKPHTPRRSFDISISYGVSVASGSASASGNLGATRLTFVSGGSW